MTHAARGPGRRREQQPDQQQSSARASGPGEARHSQNFFEPLPLGSDAFMAPLAPPREQRSIEWRQIALWCVLGTATGGAAGALVLSLVLDQQSPAAGALGHVERSTTAVERSLTEAPRAAEPEQPVAGAAATADSRPNEGTTAVDVSAAAQANAPAEAPAVGAGTAETTTTAAPEPGDLESASGSRRAGSRGEKSATRTEKLVDKPSRAQVLAAMAGVQPAVRACFEGARGTVTADMTILGRTGRVTTAQISGQSGPVGSCVARAVRRARFPKFTTESISIRYPMAF